MKLPTLGDGTCPAGFPPATQLTAEYTKRQGTFYQELDFVSANVLVRGVRGSRLRGDLGSGVKALGRPPRARLQLPPPCAACSLMWYSQRGFPLHPLPT